MVLTKDNHGEINTNEHVRSDKTAIRKL